jgi:hypothetical protein
VPTVLVAHRSRQLQHAAAISRVDVGFARAHVAPLSAALRSYALVGITALVFLYLHLTFKPL